MESTRTKQTIRIDPSDVKQYSPIPKMIRTIKGIYTKDGLTFGIIKYNGLFVKVMFMYDKMWESVAR